MPAVFLPPSFTPRQWRALLSIVAPTASALETRRAWRRLVEDGVVAPAPGPPRGRFRLRRRS